MQEHSQMSLPRQQANGIRLERNLKLLPQTCYWLRGQTLEIGLLRAVRLFPLWVMVTG
nr:MAG: hypothetical protein [Bacteroides phage NR01]